MAKKDPGFAGPELIFNPVNRLFAALYRVAPHRIREVLIAVIWGLEGGQLRSGTARALLQKYHGVTVGAFSYGSLMVPGMALAGTEIGRYVSIGPNVRRYNTHHPVDGVSLHPYWYNPILHLVDESKDMPRTGIVIDDDAWIGANVVILPGCKRIGVGAIVGAGAVVTSDVADFSIVVGLPAKPKGLRLSPATREALLRERPWQFPPPACQRILDQISASTVSSES